MTSSFDIMGNFRQYDEYCRLGKLNPSANTVVQPLQPAAPIQQTIEQRPEENGQISEKTIATAGALQVVAMALNELSRGAGNALMRGKEFTTSQNSVQIAGEMVKKNKLNVGIEYIKNSMESVNGVAGKYGIDKNSLLPVAKGQNAFYHDGIKLAVAPASKPSLMLHELGHACNAKNPLLKGLQSSRIIAFCVPTALTFLNNLMPRKKNDEPNFLERNAGKIGFLAFLPTIIEEGVASVRGIKAAKMAQETLGKLNLGPLIRNYALAWSTYLLAGIGLGIATRIAFLENKKKETQKAAKIA